MMIEICHYGNADDIKRELARRWPGLEVKKSVESRLIVKSEYGNYLNDCIEHFIDGYCAHAEIKYSVLE